MHPFDRYTPFTDVALLKEFTAKPLRKSIRVNLLKTSVEKVKAWGDERGWKLDPVPWCPEGFFIDRPLTSSGGQDREALGKDLLHILGHFYMQEAASMLPVALLDPQPGEIILDMSAAPGSKTTQIAARMGSRGVIIANDVQEKRLWTLKASLHRSGVTNAIVTKKVGQWFGKHMTERFDRVLCDAPCTAQGTARKDSDALDYCSLDNIGKMAKLQRELLETAIHAAKVGGRIVYSTCTLTPEENEEVIAAMLRKFEGKIEVVDPRDELRVTGDGLREIFEGAIEDSHRVQNSQPAEGPGRTTRNPQPLLRLWPQTLDTEGFFSAVLRKTSSTRDREWFDAVRTWEEELPSARAKELAKILEDQYGVPFLLEGERIFQGGKDQLVLATQEVAAFRMPVKDYALGLPFGKRLTDGRIFLQYESAIFRGSGATRNVCDVDEQQFQDLLVGKDSTCDAELHGHILLRYRGLCIGYGLAKEGHLKNNLPRWLIGLRTT